MAQPKPDPLDDPRVKARTRAPGATVTEPRGQQAATDRLYPVGGGYQAKYDSNSPQFQGQGHIGTAALSKKPAPAVAAFTAKLIAAGKKRS